MSFLFLFYFFFISFYFIFYFFLFYFLFLFILFFISFYFILKSRDFVDMRANIEQARVAEKIGTFLPCLYLPVIYQ